MQQEDTLVAVVEQPLTETVLRQLSTTLAHSEEVVKLTLDQLVLLVVRTLQQRVGRPNGAEAIWTLSERAQQEGALEKLGSPEVFAGRGQQLLQDLLGTTYELTLQRIAVTTGLPVAAGQLLLEVAVAAVLGTLAQMAAREGLDAQALGHWLQQQPLIARPVAAAHPIRPAATTASTPPEPEVVAHSEKARAARTSIDKAAEVPEKESLHRFTVAGAGTWEKIGGGITFTPAVRSVGKQWKQLLRPLAGWKWTYAMPVLGLVFLGGYGGGYFMLPPTQASDILERRTAVPSHFTRATLAPSPRTATGAVAAASLAAANRPSAPVVDPVVPAGQYDVASDTYIYNTGQPLILTLPDGSRQRVGANSTEYRLYSVLADPALRVDSLLGPPLVLPLDRVSFLSGKAALTEESYQQLQNLAGILKAFPRAAVKLGGYTDNAGDARRNQLLSLARAGAAKRALIALGVAGPRLLVEGYGAQAFLASNEAPVGRALNRRLSVEVLSKTGPILLPEPDERRLPATTTPKSYSSRKPSRAVVRARSKSRTRVGQWLQHLTKRVRGKRHTQS